MLEQSAVSATVEAGRPTTVARGGRISRRHVGLAMRQPIDHAGMVCPSSGYQAQGEGVAVFDVEIPADDAATGAVRLKTCTSPSRCLTVPERMA